jgi:uncharacterized membrane protein
MWRALAVLVRNAVPFTMISAAASATPFFFSWEYHSPVRSGATIVELLLYHLFRGMCEGLIVCATVQALSGGRVRSDVSIWRGLRRIESVLLTSMLTLVITAIGFVLLVIPGLIAVVAWFVAIPACVVERLGPVQSLKRSVTLTRGCGWRIFAAFCAILIVNFTVNWVIGALTPRDPAWLFAAARFGCFVLTNAYEAVLVAVVYYQLRVVKDGTHPSGIAAVFD